MEEGHSGPEQAVLSYATTGTYRDSADFESKLLPSDARTIRTQIAAAREQAKDEIRQISRSVGFDVDGWIAQAEQLQRDIERSKAVAREIVQEAQQAGSLRNSREEAYRKAELLEVEVNFTHRVQTALQHAKDVSTGLAAAQEALKLGQLTDALGKIGEADTLMLELKSLEGTNAVELLQERRERLRKSLEDDVSARWDDLVQVQSKSIAITAADDLDHTVGLLSSLDLVESKLLKLSKDLDRCVLSPRMRRRSKQPSARLIREDHVCRLQTSSSSKSDRTSEDLLEDLTGFVTFISSNLPSELSIRLSEDLMPQLVTDLMSHWLHESVPASLDALPAFEALIKRVKDFSELLAHNGWHGGSDLDDWVEQTPKNWLAKRRETALVNVRDILAERTRHTKEVERVETQMVSKSDVMAQSSGVGEDDWDSAWQADDEPAAQPAAAPKVDNAEDEDVSAWDVDDEGTSEPVKSHANGADHGDEDAWGWEEQRESHTATKHPQSNGDRKPSTSSAKERELTLKEKYTVTAVPDDLFDLLTSTINDASTLQTSTNYTNSPVQPAASALYSLPTLLLAGYRSLAPTFYTSLPSGGGNMYLYNDTTRLVSLLTTYTDHLPQSNPQAVRRTKISQDIPSLTSFAHRAYGAEMAAQRTILADLLDGAQGFANCTEPPFAAEAENAVSMTVDRIRSVAAEWKGILSRSAWLQSLGSLLSTVVAKVLLELMDLSDIGEAESVKLHEFCETIGSLSDLFVEEKEGKKQDLTGVYTPQWFRFQYLGEVLTSNLAEIQSMWSEAGLNLEFTPEEVVDLVEALFADSDRRRKLINEIRRG